MARSRIRWADTLDEEEGEFTLPPNSVKGPDSHGVKTLSEYYRNEKGDAFKKVTKTKVVNVEKKEYKVRAPAAADRAAAAACCPPAAACCLPVGGAAAASHVEPRVLSHVRHHRRER